MKLKWYYRLILSLSVGVILGGFTLAMGPTATPADGREGFFARDFVFTLTIPGILLSASFGGNTESWYVPVAALMNLLFYFGLGFLIISILSSAIPKK